MLLLSTAISIAGLSIAIAIGLDDFELTSYQLSMIRLVGQSATALAIIGGGARYLIERREELAWEKTRFIVELFSTFDDDEDYRRARLLVDHAIDSGDEGYLTKLTGPIDQLPPDLLPDRLALDRYFDFFDRLYTYIFITRTLSPRDTASFWGYVIDISQLPSLRNYALAWGYEDVLRLASSFEDDAEKRDRLLERLEPQM